MEKFMKKNLSQIISIFILLSPIIDVLTGICINTLNINFTIGILFRVLFLLFVVCISLFVFKKKQLLLPYLLFLIYFIFYAIGILIYKDNFMLNIQNLVKTYYFPIIFLSLYYIKDNLKISKMTLFSSLFLYLIFIFVPTLFGIGYETYEITKEGTLGFFNSANEISGIISILTPIMFIIIFRSKQSIPKLILLVMYLVVILMMGTKTPIIALFFTIGVSIGYLLLKSIKEKKYKNFWISICSVIVLLFGIALILPKTNFYKNIETHLDYLGLNNVFEVFTDDHLVDHFIFSSRLTFLKDKAVLYKLAPTYQKLFGIGYTNKGRETKMIEMDYFDIYFSHGLIGFIVFFMITLYILYKVLEKANMKKYEYWMLHTSLLLVVILSFFTGHIITAPSVSLVAVILILLLTKPKKKRLLFTVKNLEVGGIEKAQINLLNNINYNKYDVTLILEEKKGELLDKVNKKVNIRELKVSNNDNVIIRKLINAIRKLRFKILEYDTYDFSCCYTTYSYSCNKLTKIASINTAFYVHSDYKYVYDTEEEYREFFDSRKVNEYTRIIFVSNESKDAFLEYYPNLKDKTLVLNNFIDTEEIITKSKEKIDANRIKNKKLLVFVGRLDDSSKKLKRAINLVKEIKDFELWIVGDGPDRGRYEAFTKDCKVEDRVTFFGRQLNPYPYMAKADYIILTSDYEGFPVTYLEAITLNKDIITTIPTSDDYIDIKEYAHIISKDEKEMVKEVKNIIGEYHKYKKIDINKIQKERIKKLEELFNE